MGGPHDSIMLGYVRGAQLFGNYYKSSQNLCLHSGTFLEMIRNETPHRPNNADAGYVYYCEGAGRFVMKGEGCP